MNGQYAAARWYDVFDPSLTRSPVGTRDSVIRIAITIDQEWCPIGVLEWLLGQLDLVGVRATFFATDHPRLDLGNHEIAIHPNPFRNVNGQMHEEAARLMDMYPQAQGIRMHRLAWESGLEDSLPRLGLKYASTYLIPKTLVRPFRLGHSLVHFPIFYMDHHELLHRELYDPPFSCRALNLSDDGLYVFDFHPNLLFTNAPTEVFYRTQVHPRYQDCDALKRVRYQGRGCWTLFRELLEKFDSSATRFVTLAECLQSAEVCTAAC